MRAILFPLTLTALLLTAALFGFFYAWVCSTMWGLDAADPRVAMAAMQAMNASVRNAVFAPSFFGAAPVLALTALVAWGAGARGTAGWLGLAAGLTAAAVLLTVSTNVPMNEALGATPVPEDIEAARAIWAGYSPRWQRWNLTRTVLTGLSVAAAGVALARLPRA
ncbi:MAG: DUF1772 domain-containing protein [Rhodobacteraceae bacterium]|nr:DUF1772 domain-containing protein [Paracoccaceae bacterium]